MAFLLCLQPFPFIRSHRLQTSYFVVPLHFPSSLSHAAESHAAAVNYNYCLSNSATHFQISISWWLQFRQACRVVSPFRIWRLVPELSSTSETSVYCSASWDYWATRKFTTGERKVVGDLTRGNKLLEEKEELWSQVSG